MIAEFYAIFSTSEWICPVSLRSCASPASLSDTAMAGEETAKLVDSPVVDEGRKRVLLIAASILAARKLADRDGRPSPASESAIANAITTAEQILSRIDARWPSNQGVNR